MKSVKAVHLVVVAWGWLLTLDPAVAQNWMQTSAPITNWTSLTMSADGSNIAAVGGGTVFVSTNSGADWTPTSRTATRLLSWVGSSIALSADGKKLFALSGSSIWQSTNMGAMWSSNSTPAVFVDIAVSGNGTKLAATGGNQIYLSTNSGTGWTQSSAPSLPWTVIATSFDGTRLIAAYGVGDPRNGGIIYTSTNSGSTWMTTAGFYGLHYFDAVLSADGTTAIVTAWTYHYFRSTNSGINWSLAWEGDPFISLASSANGSKLLACSTESDGGHISISTDKGATWTQASAPPLDWTCVALSADGSKSMAAANGGGIYVSDLADMTPLMISVLDGTGNLLLSWMSTSTNFVLQQESDLASANWMDVTNEPVVNLTNFNYEVVLPITASNMFYRLRTQ